MAAVLMQLLPISLGDTNATDTFCDGVVHAGDTQLTLFLTQTYGLPLESVKYALLANAYR